MNHEPQTALAPQQHLNIDTMQRYAKAFVLSGLFKTQDTNRGLAQAFVKIQAGQELGLAPFAAMRGLNVMDGKVELSAGLMAAIVKRSGTVRYRVTDSSETACTLTWAEREGEEWVEIGTSTFTIEEAKRAGLVKTGSAWANYPSDLLFARALSRGFRRFAADLSAGAPVYVEGEVDPSIIVAPEVVAETALDAPYDPASVVGEDGDVTTVMEVTFDQETGEIGNTGSIALEQDVVDAPSPGLDPVHEPQTDPPATKVQLSQIAKLCEQVDVEQATVCERFSVADLADLTSEQARSAIRALTATADEKALA